ncbi:MAG: hypothetical protein BWY61_00737 [Firmicutes bacterium ADurb.Bin354]|nr:MAG: hypothetical protein BWY61_00737 [Firmicutes bacterium ADurb.Bin354]SCY00910.1 hypothetical protein SAMN02910370_01021 [Lachnospiraceae bacterium XPB1003]
MSEPGKINNLKTKNLPPLFMMCGGAVALIICLIRGTELLKTLIVVFLALLIFAILGTVVKSIVDKFNMTMHYSDYFEDLGDLVEKRTGDDL